MLQQLGQEELVFQQCTEWMFWDILRMSPSTRQHRGAFFEVVKRPSLHPISLAQFNVQSTLKNEKRVVFEGSNRSVICCSTARNSTPWMRLRGDVTQDDSALHVAAVQHMDATTNVDVDRLGGVFDPVKSLSFTRFDGSTCYCSCCSVYLSSGPYISSSTQIRPTTVFFDRVLRAVKGHFAKC